MGPGAAESGAQPGRPEPGRAEPSALRQIRESARALLAEGKAEEAWELFVSALEAVLVRNRELELLVAKLRRAQVGRKSERIDPAQLRLLLETLSEQATEPAPFDPEEEARQDAQLDADIEAAGQGRKGSGRKPRKKGPGWKARAVERRVHGVEVPASERRCARCGGSKARIGGDVTRRLEYVPAHFVEHEYHLDKYACGACKEGVTTAAAPAQVLDRSAADASLLAHVVVSKFADHTPLHRLGRIYARSGVDLPVSTLADWTGGVAEVVGPLVEALARRVLQAHIVGTDATGLNVLDATQPDNIQRGTIWNYVGDGRDVLFRYTPSGEGAAGPWEYLAGRRGYVQADASSVYDRLFNGRVAVAVELGCWAHTRRKLETLQDTDCRVAYPLKLIARLYRVEHLADAREVTPEGRVALRRERSAPILEKLKRWFVATTQTETPGSELTKAAAYALNHWTALTRFVEDGRIKLDNNVVEQQIRDIALGRRNYLLAGSHEAARHAAALYSLTRTCAQYGVPPLEYFTDVLTKLASGWDVTRLDELLPHRWRAPDGTSQTAQGPQRSSRFSSVPF
jgi:transposase